MLQHLPRVLGRSLRRVRSGPAALTIHWGPAQGRGRLAVTSPTFGDGGLLPARFTADGPGVSPPIAWSGVPEGARAVVVLVEDADSPTPRPLVHALVHDLPLADAALAEGALPGPAPGVPGQGDGRQAMGRNSYFGTSWLPPDPPPAHGAHRYAFQVFALSARPDLGEAPGRARLRAALRGRVLASGLLTGLYVRR